MAKKIKQFRFYKEYSSNSENSEEEIKNEPKTATLDGFVSGTVFKDYFPITQLGIQGLPGTKFFINGSTDPITIGASGIYDLDIKNGIRITELQFWQTSMENIRDNGAGYLIVDILYGEED